MPSLFRRLVKRKVVLSISIAIILCLINQPHAWAKRSSRKAKQAKVSAVCEAKKKIHFVNEFENRLIHYFLNTATPEGLTPDRFTTNDIRNQPYSIAASGFYLSALTIAVERGVLSRSEGTKRALATLNFIYAESPREHGFLYHFIDDKGNPYGESEVSTVDTAIFLAGALHAGDYFKGAVKTKAEQFYRETEWPWIFDASKGWLYWSWSQSTGFHRHIDAYSEATMAYLLAIGSPTHPIPADSFYRINRYKGNYSTKDLVYTYFGSLFAYQYSHAWFDFRGTKDALGTDWWANSVDATISNRNYCLDNSEKGYTGYFWGLSASDGPWGYRGYGSLPAKEHFDDGTISPAAIAGSIAMLPEICINSLTTLKQIYAGSLWSTYGFKSAVNDIENWISDDYLSIDQGISLLMLANFRDGCVWKSFMKNVHVKRAMSRVGFSGYEADTKLIEDFEDGDFNTPDNSFWWRVSNPGVFEIDHANSPAYEGSYSMSVLFDKGDDPWANLFGDMSRRNKFKDYSSYRYLEMRVQGEVDILAKLRNRSGQERDLERIRSEENFEWNIFLFKLPDYDFDLTDIERLLLFPAPGREVENGLFYVDSLRLVNPDKSNVDDFEDNDLWSPETTLGWWDWDGTEVYERTLDDDPSLGGLRSMRVVYDKRGKDGTGYPWSFFSGEIAESNPLRDFSGKSKLIVWVWGAVELLVKLEDRFANQEDLSIQSSENTYGWTKLVYDFTHLSNVNLTDIKQIHFFAAPGNSEAQGEFYIDDIFVI